MFFETNNSVVNSVLHYSEIGDGTDPIWSKTVHRGLKYFNFDESGYRVSQLMEPSFVQEIAKAVDVSEKTLCGLRYESDGPAMSIKWLLDMVDWTTPIQRLNLSCCLATTARYHVARDVLGKISENDLLSHERYSYYITKFFIDNRLGDVDSHDSEFHHMRVMAESNNLNDVQLLEASSQAIVWRIKTGRVSKDLAGWFEKEGSRVASRLGEGTSTRERLALSSFYRALAMVPAAMSDRDKTRRLMRRSKYFANVASIETPLDECMVLNAKKTMMESTLKEMLYLREDIEAAEEVGLELVALDPYWSISYHELAEVYLSKKDYSAALKQYKQALELKFPRFTFSQYMIGACYQQLEEHERAIECFRNTLAFDKTNISAGICGYNISKKQSHPSHDFFKEVLSNWSGDGILTDAHKEMVV